MRIVIDSNVLFSALIRDSTTRKLILEYEGQFLFPSIIFEEMEKHKEELMKKSGQDKHEFEQLLELILNKVIVVPIEMIISHKELAKKIVEKIDINDAPFIACVLAYKDSLLWSEDKALKQQNKVKVLNTKEIIEFLKN